MSKTQFKTMLKFQFVFFVLLLKLCSAKLPELGDQCKTIGDGEQGTCKLLSDCPEAKELFRTTRQLPQSCTPDNVDVVVCCVNVASPVFKSKSLAKCKEYSDRVPCTMTPLSEMPLIDNRLTSIRHFPHIANILYSKKPADDNTYFIDDQGLLVSSRYVISTAALMRITGLMPAKVLLGLIDRLKWVENETATYNVEKIIVHPNYQPSSLINDIALIKLSKEIIFSQYVRPICLPDSNVDILPSLVYRINYEYNILRRPLVKYQRRPVSNDMCNVTYTSHELFSGFNDSFICTQPAESMEPHYLYRFDGAPITIDHPNVNCSHVLFGMSIVTQESRTADAAIKVFHYLEWIEGIIWSDDDDTHPDLIVNVV